MTGKTLKERLPVGNQRNKIEFLADAMEQTAAELFDRMAAMGQPVTNYVRNPAFLDCSSNKAQETKFEGLEKPGAILGGPHQNAGAFADCWNFEQDGNQLDPAGSNPAFGAHRNLHFPPFFTSVPFKANDIWCSVRNCKGAVYQNLQLPRREAYYKARCFFATDAGVTLTLGFRLVDPYEVGRAKSEVTMMTTASMYEAPPSTGYEVQTLETDIYKVTRSQNNPEIVFLEMQSRPGEMDSVMLLGMQVFETDQDGNMLESGDIDMSSDGMGYTRFNDSIEFECVDTSPQGNRFVFKASGTAGISLECPSGIENHLLFSALNAANQYFYDGAEIVEFDGQQITLELSQANADKVRGASYMVFYGRYTRTPLLRGLY